MLAIWCLLIASQLSRNSHKRSISVYQSINLVSLQFTPQKTKEAGWLAKANSFLICRLSAKSRLLLTHLWTEVVRSADCGPCDRLASRTLRTSTNSSLVAEGPKGNILCAAAMARTGKNMEKPAPPTFLPEISWHHVGNIEWNEKASMLESVFGPCTLSQAMWLTCKSDMLFKDPNTPEHKINLNQSLAHYSKFATVYTQYLRILACVELRTLAMPKSPIFKLPRTEKQVPVRKNGRLQTEQT